MDTATPGGYVKLWRSWIDHPIWADMPPACGRIALTCLCLANWKPAKWYDGRAEVVIPRGSFVTSLEKLSAAAGTSKKQTRYGLHKLEFVAQFLTTKRTHRWTLVSITNYELYQSGEAEEGTVNNIEKGTLGAQQGHSKGTVVALIEEEKKGRREEETHTPPLPLLSPRQERKPARTSKAPDNGVNYTELWRWTQQTYPVTVFEPDSRLLIGAVDTPALEQQFRANLLLWLKTRQWSERGAVPAFSKFMSEQRWKTARKEPEQLDPIAAKFRGI